MSVPYEETIINNHKTRCIIANEEYIKWLKDFTEEIPEFYVDDWYVLRKKISLEEAKKMVDLKYLFNAIDNYADKYNISPTYDTVKNVVCYSIKYKDSKFRIGANFYQPGCYYCERKDSLNKTIEFQDIMKNKKPDSPKVKEKMTELSGTIDELLGLNISPERIQEQVDMTLGKVKKKVKKM